MKDDIAPAAQAVTTAKEIGLAAVRVLWGCLSVQQAPAGMQNMFAGGVMMACINVLCCH